MNFGASKSTIKKHWFFNERGQKRRSHTAIRNQVTEIKEECKVLEDTMKTASDQLQQLLYDIPNIPYSIVPEGTAAEDNVIVKEGGSKPNLDKKQNPIGS